MREGWEHYNAAVKRHTHDKIVMLWFAWGFMAASVLILLCDRDRSNSFTTTFISVLCAGVAQFSGKKALHAALERDRAETAEAKAEAEAENARQANSPWRDAIREYRERQQS